MQSTSIQLGEHNPTGHTQTEVVAALTGHAVWTEYIDDAEVPGMGGVLVDQGEQAWLELVTSVNYHLRLFLGDPTDGLTDAQVDALDEGDMTEASFLGYEAKLLTGGDWSVAARVAEFAKKGFVSAANQTGQVVGGYYLTRASNGEMVMFELFASPVTVSGSGQVISVTPKITLGEDY